MKVHVRKGDYQSPIPGLVIMSIFLGISIFICYAAAYGIKTEGYSIFEFSIPLAFALVFFSFSLYFLYALFKKPKGYQALLIEKTLTQYKGKDITLMRFKALVVDEKKISVPNEYICFTYGTNELILRNEYIIKIKEFNWKIKAVEELHGYETEDSAKKVPNIAMVPVVLGIGFIFSSIGIWAIFNIIKNPQPAIIYAIPLLFSLGAISRYNSLLQLFNFCAIKF